MMPGDDFQNMPKALAITLRLAAIVLFGSLAFLVYGHVFADGLCCADDSTNAIVAKNLAFGKGYSNSIRFDGVPGSRLFDPGITTGPTLNLPAALLIRIFGNAPWVPGFVTATFSLGLIAVMFLVMRRGINLNDDAAYICVLIVLFYCLTAGLHFEHWYSLIGEIPAVLLCMVGAAILAVKPDERPAIILASALYGLAVTTKLVALLGFIPVFVWLLWRIFAAKSFDRRCAVDAILGGVAFLAPFAAVELWKLLVLGGHLYIVYIKDFIGIFAANAGKSGSYSISGLVKGALHLYAANALTMQQHFGYSPMTLLVIAVLVAGCVYSYSQQRTVRLLFTWLLAGAMMHALWWLFISPGRPRYALIGLLLYFAAISCLVFTRLSWRIVGTMTVLLLIIFSAGYPRMVAPIQFVASTKYKYDARVKNLIKTAAFLAKLPPSQTLVMGWWATAGDVEYAMPTVGNFIQSDAISPNRKYTGAIVVRNKVWLTFWPSPEFAAWEQKCNDVLLDAPPYLVSRCPDGSPTGNATPPNSSSSPRN